MRRMSFGIASLALVASLAVAGNAFAKTGVITIDGQVGGKQKPTFDKKKFKPTRIKIDTTTADADDPSALPPKVNQSVVKFDSKDIRFDHTAVPGCDPSQIATATTEGLTVPVVRDVDRQPLLAIAAEIRRLAEAARTGTLKLEELQGGTFTVTSTGARGGLLATPIVHHPQVAPTNPEPRR